MIEYLQEDEVKTLSCHSLVNINRLEETDDPKEQVAAGFYEVSQNFLDFKGNQQTAEEEYKRLYLFCGKPLKNSSSRKGKEERILVFRATFLIEDLFEVKARRIYRANLRESAIFEKN